MENVIYTSSMTIAVPETLCPVAAPIARAFDPLSGGDKSFDFIRAIDATCTTVDETTTCTPVPSGTVWAICHSPCTPETAGALTFLQSVPGLLHQKVSNDYAIRWPDTEMPTLEQCETFRSAIRFATGKTLDEALAQMNLVRVADTGNE